MFVLSGLLVSLIAIMVLTRMDRVITSQGGKIVPTQQVNVFQALDTSLIRSIDVREGQRVQKGQLLATLDPTFTSADVQQLKEQSTSLEAQIARDRAELDQQPLVFLPSSESEANKYYALQKAFYDQRSCAIPGSVEQFRRQNPADAEPRSKSFRPMRTPIKSVLTLPRKSRTCARFSPSMAPGHSSTS